MRIRADPDFHGGTYTNEPHLWRAVLPVFATMGGNPRILQQEAPTREAAEASDAGLVAAGSKLDADDDLATFNSSWDFDPSNGLDRITVPFLAVNFADDLLNPPDLGTTEAAMAYVQGGRSVLIPAGPDTFGHMTLAHPAVWGPALTSFMGRLP